MPRLLDGVIQPVPHFPDPVRGNTVFYIYASDKAHSLIASVVGIYPWFYVTLPMMPTDHILALLIAERDKLNRAIEALGAEPKRRGRLPGSKNGQPATQTVAEPAAKSVKKKWTPAQREEARARAKAMWAKRKKAARKTA